MGKNTRRSEYILLSQIKHFFSSYKQILSIAVAIFFVLEILILMGVDYFKYQDIKSYQRIKAEDTDAHVRMVLAGISDSAGIFFDTLVKSDEIIEIMTQASRTKDQDELSQLREKLYKLCKNQYTYLKSHNVRQLHFHLPSVESFLRFHRPKKYGDSLEGIRKDVEFVRESKKKLSVFTEGRIFNGFRNVFPPF